MNTKISMNQTRPTAQAAELINVRMEQPNSGAHVWALTHGGKLVETIWKSNSILYFDAWAPYPKIPKEVKELQLSRFMKV